MARKASTETTATTALDALRAAVWQHISVTDVAVQAMKDAGAETEDVKSLVLRTYMARRMNPGAASCTDAMLKKAEIVLSLPGAGSKGEGKKRTQEQERFYTGARQYLFALRKKAGVEASDGRGGANNTGSRAPRTPAGGEDGTPTAPPAKGATITNGLELRAFVAKQAGMLAMLCEKHNAMCDAKLRKEVDTFKRRVDALVPAAD